MIAQPRAASCDIDIVRDGRVVRDAVAVEEPLEIRIADAPVAVVMRTPGQDEELAAGLLWTEGLVERPEHIDGVRICSQTIGEAAGNVVLVELAPGAAPDPGRLARSLPASAACGICGKTRIDQVRVRGRPLGDGPAIRRDVLARLPGSMQAAQSVFTRTGGLHAAALFDPDGGLRCLREDIGRHNAVDKIVGWALFADRIPLSQGVLMVSGRAGFEIVQKAYVAGVCMLASISAPSSLAVALAAETGMTLAGFVRDGGMNIYAHPRRIIDGAAPRAAE